MQNSSQYARKNKHVVKIDLKGTVLGQKYCIYHQLQRMANKIVYLGLNIYNKQSYTIHFYQMNGYQSEEEKQKIRYKLLRKAEFHYRIECPYIMKCYDVYQNDYYLAIVYEYFDMLPLSEQIKIKVVQVDQPNINQIMRCILGAVESVHAYGYLVKRISPNTIYYKDGVYKLSNIQIFESQKQKSPQYAPQILTNQITQTIYNTKQNQYKCDVFLLGLFYLCLLFHFQFNPHQLLKCQQQSQQQSVYHRKLELMINNKYVMNQGDNRFLKYSLVLNYRNRMSWSDLITSRKQWRECPGVKQNYPKQQSYNNRNSQLMSNMIGYLSQEIRPNFVIPFQNDINSKQLPIQRDFQNYMVMRDFSFMAISSQDLYIHLKSKEQGQQKKRNKIQKFTNHLLQIKKADFIIRNIIEPILNFHLLKMKHSHNIQYMYLVISRCLIDITNGYTFINSLDYNIRKTIQFNKQWLASLRSKIIKIFDDHSKQLTTKQSEKLQIIKNFLVDKAVKFQQERFLTGVESIDFTRDEQISFTCQYNRKIIEQINRNMGGRAVSNLVHIYKQILMLDETSRSLDIDFHVNKLQKQLRSFDMKIEEDQQPTLFRKISDKLKRSFHQRQQN